MADKRYSLGRRGKVDDGQSQAILLMAERVGELTRRAEALVAEGRLPNDAEMLDCVRGMVILASAMIVLGTKYAPSSHESANMALAINVCAGGSQILASLGLPFPQHTSTELVLGAIDPADSDRYREAADTYRVESIALTERARAIRADRADCPQANVAAALYGKRG